MAFDVVTAKQGKPHVTAEQQAMLHAGMLGKGRYRLDVLNGLACSMTDSNTLTVDTGGLMVDGRWVVNEAQTSFAIANGGQSAFRHDLAVLKIATDASTGITTIEEKVLQGASAATAAAAKDPAYDAGDLLDGLTAVVPIARIKLDGLTPTCEALLPSVADLKTLGDSVSRISKSNYWTVLAMPSGLRAAWTTEGTGRIPPESGATKEIELPFKIKAGNAISVLSAQTDIGTTAEAGFTQLTTKVTSTSDSVFLSSYNDSSTMTLNTSVSILVIERIVY